MVSPEGKLTEIKWEVPSDFALETVVCDRSGKMFMISDSRTYVWDPGTKPELLAEVGSVAGAAVLDTEGSLLIAPKDKVMRIDASGKVTIVAEGFKEIYGLAVDSSGNIYASEWADGKIMKTNRDGKTEKFAEGFEFPSGLVFDKEGNLYVKESGRQKNKKARIKKVTPAGKVEDFVVIAAAESIIGPWAFAFISIGFVASAFVWRRRWNSRM